MKLMYRTVCLLAVITFTLSSCVKHGDIFQPKEPERTADLNVPEGFDWGATRTVSLTVNSPVSTVASFFLDESCTPEKQIGTLLVPEGETTFKFDIPYVDKVIYARYTSENGEIKTLKSTILETRAIEGAANQMFFDRPQLSSTMIGNDFVQFINIPNGYEFGTLMFEDTWPETEDYDFNDVVVNYKIKVSYNWAGMEEGSWDAPANDIIIRVLLKIRALGGNLPYDFALQIGQTSSHEGAGLSAADMGDIIDIESTNQDITVEKLEGVNFPAVIVKGLNSLRGPGYYNTVIKKDEGVNISFNIRIKGTKDQQPKRMQNSLFTDPKAFDYFLINRLNHKEIHLIGFAPTPLYTGYEADNIGGGTYYYQNDKGLVWGLKAPGAIGWAAEKHDILTVYTQFRKWVESGGYVIGPNGVDPLDWYNHHTKGNFIEP